MVKILASGEIVADDDPRAGGGDNRASGQSGYNAPRQRQVSFRFSLDLINIQLYMLNKSN